MPILRKLLVALAVFTVVLGGTWLYLSETGNSDLPLAATEGPRVTLGEPDPQSLPRVNIPKIVGWAANEAPTAAPGLVVNRFAEGLRHPRTMLTLPNGDVIVAETGQPASADPGVMERIQNWFMARAGAGPGSANALVLLRDGDGDGRAEQKFVLREGNGLESPSGLAWGNGKLYVANHNAVLAFDYAPGATALAGNPVKLRDLPGGGGHWMRNLVLSPDGKLLYVAIGSATNIGAADMAVEKGRAELVEIDLATGEGRTFAAGLRNPNGLDWNPATGDLWVTVNERDMLGPDLVPDYLASVPIGAHFGWPWYYFRTNLDNRVEAPLPEFLNSEYVKKPEYALGAHTASLGLKFAGGGNRLGPQFENGAFIARHGSWNRKPASGYDVVFVKFDANGNPRGQPVPVLTGFLNPKGQIRGRPTWLTFDRTGALLLSDDTSGIVWRVVLPGAAPAAAIKPLAGGKLPPQRSIDTALEAEFKRKAEDAQ